MLTRTVIVTGLLAVLSFAGPRQEATSPELAAAVETFKQEVPKLPEKLAGLVEAPEPQPVTASLPKPSLTEPFEIGEALYDEGRVADAVMSLLGLMKVAVVPDASASARATGLTLSESEVSALIDLAEEDLAASENDMERLPYKFSDLHAGIAALLPGVTVEALAEAYTKAYEAHADDLIAKAMMGRPIEPDTTLTRAQLWFLLMDGFAGAAAGGAQWGTADRDVPNLTTPDARWSPEEFREVLARLPLVTAPRLVTMSAPDVFSPGATGGPPVNVTARVAAAAPPLVSRSSGRTLLPSRGGSLAGQEVTWAVSDESMLPELGKIVTQVGEPARVGADGIARFVVQPGVDPTRGAGQLVNDWEPVEARFDRRGLLASAYTVPAALEGLALGTTTARANIRLRYRSSDVLWLGILNKYENINFDIPGLGGGTRNGFDELYAFVRKRANGSYWGHGEAEVMMEQTLRGGDSATQCRQKESVVTKQKVRVQVDPETGFGPTHILADFRWSDVQHNLGRSMATVPPDGGYYRVMIYPITGPPNAGGCISNIPVAGDRRTHSRAKWFIPLNDAQWTTPAQGYGIALKAKGLTMYYDNSSKDPLAGTPLAAVKSLLKLTGSSVWIVLVARSASDLPSK